MKKLLVGIFMFVMVIIGVFALNTHSMAKTYSADGKKFYHLTGKLITKDNWDRRGNPRTEFILKLSKKIKVHSKFYKCTDKIKKLTLDYYTSRALFSRQGKRVHIICKIGRSVSAYRSCMYYGYDWYFDGGKKPSAAAPKIVELEESTLYKGYDVTGDGKTDSIIYMSEISYNNDVQYDSMKLMINGKEVFSHDEFEGQPRVNLLLIQNDTVLLEVTHYGEDATKLTWICSYKGSKWKELKDLTENDGDYAWTVGSVEEVSSDIIKVNYSGLTGLVGAISYSKEYEFTNDTLVEKDQAVDLYITKRGTGSNEPVKNQVMTASRKMKVYCQADFSSSIAYQITSGDDVMFSQIIVIDGRPWFYVISDGDQGWLPGEAFNEQEYYFKDTVFYG